MENIVIDQLSNIEIAPSLQDGGLANSGRSLVAAAKSLGDGPFASVLRAWCVPYLFTAMEQLLEYGEDPIAGINVAMDELTRFIESAGVPGFNRISIQAEQVAPTNGRSPEDVKEKTGAHYGNLFKEFSTKSFWDEPKMLLEQRLVRNGVFAADIENKKVLDSGCGGGRYSVAWRLLGAAPVVGVDISPINIDDANRRVEMANLESVSFEPGNVLDLPFPENEFDIVFSNGVLHHTTDWEKGVAELVRVLKPGGIGWLYLIENPGGVFWDVIEILRVIMKNEEKAKARRALQMLDMPANRIFYMLDHVMVPINVRLSPRQIEDCLTSAGASNIRRLARGADIDRIERVFHNEPFAAERFGVGENRYLFSKS
jgi:ubiquinone/menaquinone biosynthesis C-methylase UbiE